MHTGYTHTYLYMYVYIYICICRYIHLCFVAGVSSYGAVCRRSQATPMPLAPPAPAVPAAPPAGPPMNLGFRFIHRNQDYPSPYPPPPPPQLRAIWPYFGLRGVWLGVVLGSMIHGPLHSGKLTYNLKRALYRLLPSFNSRAPFSSFMLICRSVASWMSGDRYPSTLNLVTRILSLLSKPAITSSGFTTNQG